MVVTFLLFVFIIWAVPVFLKKKDASWLFEYIKKYLINLKLDLAKMFRGEMTTKQIFKHQFGINFISLTFLFVFSRNAYIPIFILAFYTMYMLIMIRGVWLVTASYSSVLNRKITRLFYTSSSVLAIMLCLGFILVILMTRFGVNFR